MALTKITDVVIPEVYASYSTVDDVEKTALFESGVIQKNDNLTAQASSGGHTLDIPYWKDLDASTEPNLSSDDPTQQADPDKLASGLMIARNAYLNNWWSTADLAGELAGDDPMQRIRKRTARYWQRQAQRRLLAMTKGILAGNIANDDGDMVYDISVDTAAGITSSNLFKRDAFTGSAFTLGDMVSDIQSIAVHSMIHKRMVDNDDVEQIRDSQGNLIMETYMGKRLIVDDGMPVAPVTTGTGFKYTSVLFGAGAIGYGDGNPKMDMEVKRDGTGGNGGGIELLGERKTWLFHPFGFKMANTPANAAGHTLAELGTAGTYVRDLERKHIPVAFLVTNG